MRGPWVVPDEIIYLDLAKSIAAGHGPAIRGATTLGYGLGYPLLIAPAWAMGWSPHTAYLAALAIGALVMSSAAIPAYLLARRFVAHHGALAVASLSVIVPAMGLTSTLLTETAYYPAFLWALFSIVISLERLTRKRQVGALLAIAIAAAIKLLGLVLVPIYCTSILLATFLDRNGESVRLRIGRFRLSLVTIGVLGLIATSLSIVRTFGATGMLGAYSGVLTHIDAVGLPWAFVLHVAAVDITSGIVPFAASALVFLCVARGIVRDPRAVRLASLAAACVIWLPATVAIASGAIKAGSAGLGANAHLHERYVFTIAPLLLTCMAACLEWRLRRRSRRAVAAAAATAALVAVVPVEHLRDNASLQAPSLVLWLHLPYGRLALGAAGLVAAVLFVMIMRSTWILWTGIAGTFVVGALLTYGSSYVTLSTARDVGMGAPPGWIDTHVPAGSRVVVLWNEPGRVGNVASPQPWQRVIWENEFFNRSVQAVYALGAASPEPVPREIRARVRADGLLEDENRRLLRPAFVLTCGIRLAAPVVAVDSETSAVLYRTSGRPRVARVGLSTCVGRGVVAG